MKVIVTGSLGNISKLLTENLIRKGQEVVVISSKPEKQKDIEALGAKAAIGSVDDADFLTKTFTGADVVYTMVPPPSYFDPNLDMNAYWNRIGNSYVEAIRTSGIKRVINLSSWGADKSYGTGGILGAYYVEQMLNQIQDIHLTHIRPTSFYYNLFGNIRSIKTAGMMASNYGGDDVTVLVAPSDIAEAVAEEIITPGSKTIRYVASDECTCNDVARVLGESIGKPDLKWVIIPAEQVKKNLEAAGMNPQIVASVVELQSAHHSGWIAEDYYRNKPVKMGKIKIEDFAKEFAAAYTKQQ